MKKRPGGSFRNLGNSCLTFKGPKVRTDLVECTLTGKGGTQCLKAISLDDDVSGSPKNSGARSKFPFMGTIRDDK